MSKEIPIKDKIHDNPKDWKCCWCKAEMQKRMSTTGDGVLRKGLVIVCSNCARPNVLGDTGLHPLTKDEFMALSPESKRALLLTAQGVKQLVESGGTWNPYTNQ